MKKFYCWEKMILLELKLKSYAIFSFVRIVGMLQSIGNRIKMEITELDLEIEDIEW